MKQNSVPRKPSQRPTTIEDIITQLDNIIGFSKENQDPLGYFAVLYRRVTIEVKRGIETRFFDDAARMEQLDIIFAQKYLNAYYNHKKGNNVSQSWQKAFRLSKNYWPITLQHLLIGMNAHINLDLGIAAAEVSKGKNIMHLQNDFYKINQILASLVHEVQVNLCTIWPPLRSILLKTGQYDNLLVDFSMEIARDGAWDFAKKLSTTREAEMAECIENRDLAVAKTADIITTNRFSIKLLLSIVRLGEVGTVAEKIRKLEYVNPERKNGLP